MVGNERFDDSIGRWLEETAPGRLPERVLEATFERTRRTRQGAAWRVAVGRPSMPRSVPALGGAAVVVVAVATLALGFGLIGGNSGPPTSSPTASPSPSPQQSSTSGSMWPQSTLEEVQAAQALADAGQLRTWWQIDADLGAYLSQGGPYRSEIFRRFLTEKLGWEKFKWTRGQADNEGVVVFLRCVPGPGDQCDPTIDGSQYEKVQVNMAQPARQGPDGIWVVSSWEMLEPFVPPAPPEADVAELFNGFLEARVAGRGAEQFLDDPAESIPVLYATSSGSPYERGGFSEVHGYDWPYGLRAFTVWLEVDGSVVVNQLFFMPADGRRRLDYVPDGFGTDLAPTVESGLPLATSYTAFDGEVTLRIANPWVFRSGSASIKLVPDGSYIPPTTDGGERTDWDRLVLIADPTRSGSGCPTVPGPVDAEALTASIRSDPNLVTTDPAATSAGGADGVWIDVRLADVSSGACGSLSGLTELQLTESVGLGAGDGMRLWLFDAPEGSAMRVMAVAMVVPESRFESAAAAAASLSVDFSTR